MLISSIATSHGSMFPLSLNARFGWNPPPSRLFIHCLQSTP